MTGSWRHLPSPARPVAVAASAAVDAVQGNLAVAFDAAVAELAGLEQAHAGLILGTTVRLLLEDGHPDGLAADDVREALASCVRAHPEADPQVVLWLLAGALGVLDEDGAPGPKPDALARNAMLLITDLLAGRDLRDWLTAALTEIQRTQLND
ncbi:hypothetical protein ACWT_7374 [Actinoplanes sp. SE50]|uniref:hypothetical protein n=1 Tax=unclassified Actinoplanes TaxID=2626549 RepID=UPI00023EE01E|nr:MULTISPECIES: hypothetical protein [unclassified Actinoplanes]AEV88384.1 hypothetical protein ACPL_7504 [Actinoplanes sp. SE50/110]ATO86789.1 hypothetical protein ACWT_7374 [Actinoplanes sp. SE50]SLM04207.1 hypothetical protein ACSP50_7510 [Actinoplanes sp. SE50/110]